MKARRRADRAPAAISDEARERAEEIAKERGYEYGKSFDKDLVLGVATYAYELFTAEPALDACRADRAGSASAA